MSKKCFCLLLLSMFVFANNAFAKGDFSDIDSIHTIKCTGNSENGSINDYDKVTDYYTFKNGEIYSSNLNNLYGDLTKDPKKVLKLKITDDYITFKDRLIKFEVTYYKWVKIDRKTGEYAFNAKNDYGYFYKKANVRGKCTVEN